MTALMHAAEGNSVEVVRLLLDHGAIINEKDKVIDTSFVCLFDLHIIHRVNFIFFICWIIQRIIGPL